MIVETSLYYVILDRRRLIENLTGRRPVLSDLIFNCYFHNLSEYIYAAEIKVLQVN